MKKVVSVCCLVALLCTLCPTAVTAQEGRGGIVSFLVGCCLGIREGTEYNEGKDIHWREWCHAIPIVNIVFGIWNGIECAGGITAHEWAEKNGANWY